MTELTIKSQPKHYAKGTRFERKVRMDLEALGYSVIRAAGSKGDAKVDLIAFHPSRPMMLVQCKTSGKIPKSEWDRLYEVAGWYPAACVPVLASNGARGQGVAYEAIEGLRVPYARTQPSRRYLPGLTGEPPELVEHGSPDYHG